jgi:hypothetical protein
MAEKGSKIGFHGIFYLDVQKLVSVTYETKQKNRMRNGALLHTAPLWHPSTIAAGPQDLGWHQGTWVRKHSTYP